MKVFKWIWCKLGFAKHNYKLMGNADRHRCTKCGNIIYIPPYSEFWYSSFRGCKKS